MGSKVVTGCYLHRVWSITPACSERFGTLLPCAVKGGSSYNQSFGGEMMFAGLNVANLVPLVGPLGMPSAHSSSPSKALILLSSQQDEKIMATGGFNDVYLAVVLLLFAALSWQCEGARHKTWKEQQEADRVKLPGQPKVKFA